MKSILQINAIIELLAGFVLLFNPHLLLNHTNPNIQGIVIAKLYGILAFFFGLVCFILSKHFDYNQLYKQIILSIITFHFVVGLYMYGVYNQHVTPHPGAAILHVGLALIFMIIYLKKLEKFKV